jgi:RNA polymerase sigma-70 factor (ECF subfamily)
VVKPRSTHVLDEQELKRLLLRTAVRGQESAAAFEALYRKCAPLLLGIARRIIGRRELAEEVVHDSFVRIWRSAEQFDASSGQAFAWMVAIVRNRAIDVLQSHDVARVQPLDLDDEADAGGLFDWALGPEDDVDAKRTARALHRCLAELQAAERQSLVLAYAHAMSHTELASHLHKPLGTVKGLIRRGLAHLRDCLERCAEAVR